ncbi:MAG: DUF1559 domain-containing protein [Pirellulales bacterium]|nr:DUF1559 domain-containing protein [Pirellulales bacterium]
MHHKKNRGFTLVELLVVIAIVGILVSLLLPAIQASRESARRSQCIHNMQQLILAVNSYEMAHEEYPSGVVDTSGPIQNVPAGYHVGWIVRILPYMELRAHYRALDLSVGVYDPKNNSVRQMVIGGIICPSYSGNTAPFSCYAACHHDIEAPIDADNHGVFFLNSHVTYDDLLDGAGYTLFLGEMIPHPKSDLGWMSGTPATLRNTGSPLNAKLPANIIPEDYNFYEPEQPWVEPVVDGYWDPDVGEYWDEEEMPPVSDAKEQDQDGVVPRRLRGGDPANPLFVGGFGSCHLDGAVMAMGDGSVRYMEEGVAQAILQRLAHREDGKLVSDADW